MVGGDSQVKHAKLIRSIEDLIWTVEKTHAAFQQRYDGDVAAGLDRAARQARLLKEILIDFVQNEAQR